MIQQPLCFASVLCTPVTDLPREQEPTVRHPICIKVVRLLFSQMMFKLLSP